MPILGSFQTAAFTVAVTLAAYFLVKLYQARKLVFEKQKRGLVSEFASLITSPPLTPSIGSLWLLIIVSSSGIYCILSP